MALSTLDRARIILDLVKDGEVATEAAYANVDKIGAAAGNKWAEAFYDAYGPIMGIDEETGGQVPLAFEDLTNAEKGAFYMNQLRLWHQNVLLGVRLGSARETAANTERATVLAEVASELGVSE